MIITEAAEYLGISSDKIINELTRKHPETAWKSTSEVPDDFVQKAEEVADQYVREVTPQIGGGQMTLAEATDITTDAAEFGILTALQECENSFFAYIGKVHALQQIQVFEGSKADTWAQHYMKRDATVNAHADQIKQQVESFLPLAAKRQKLTARLTAKNTATKKKIANLPKL